MSPMNNRLLVPRKTPGLLDLVPGAAAAYSLRSLSNSYAGPVVTVRRSSDDAEEDFTAAEVSDGTLAAFCGAGDGFVKTWHSQTGSNDATQTTAGYQPKIVGGGVVILEEGKPAIQFNGASTFFASNSLASVFSGTDVPHTRIILLSPSSTSVNYELVSPGDASGTPLKSIYINGATAKYTINIRDNASVLKGPHGTASVSVAQEVVCDFCSGTSSTVSKNGVTYGPYDMDVGNVSLTTFTIGAINRIGAISAYFSGKMQEVLIYPSDQSANRELLEGQIAWSYSQ